MSGQELLEHWRERLSGFVPGRDMTVAQWCRQQHVTKHQYRYWRRRLEDEAAGPAPTAEQAPQWLAVDLTEPRTPARPNPRRGTPAGPEPPLGTGGISLFVQGVRIALEPGFDAGMLGAVVRALRAA
jgi:hypothetical protein